MELKKLSLIAFGVLLVTSIYGQSRVVDSRDNKSYPSRVIGENVWMTENLKFNKDFAYFYYLGADEVYYDTRHVKKDTLCPQGWHIPTLEDWKAIETSLDLAGVALCGWVKDGRFENFRQAGAYWTSTKDSAGQYHYVVKLDDLESGLKVESGQSTMASCRCVKE